MGSGAMRVVRPSAAVSDWSMVYCMYQTVIILKSHCKMRLRYGNGYHRTVLPY
jgi:hypothetical protein